MPEPKKTRRCWLYVTEEDDVILQSLVKKLGAHYNETLVLSIIASAGLKACQEAGTRLPHEFSFKVVDDEARNARLNEPQPTKRK